MTSSLSWFRSKNQSAPPAALPHENIQEALLSVAAPAPTFVELKEPEPAPPVSESMKKEDSFSIVAVVKKSSYSIEITNLASASFLQNLLEAMNHA